MRRMILMAALAAALNLGAKEWSLEECVSYAVENNLTVLQRQNQKLQAEYELTAAKDGVLPTVSASAQQSWSFGRGLTASNTYADRNTGNFGLNLALNLPLFQGLQNVRQVSYQRTYLRAVVEEMESAKDDVTLMVISQYLQVLYCGEMQSIAESQVELTGTELERRKALLNAGRIPEADMLDAASQDAQARVQLVNAQNDRRLALLDLTQLLRLKDDDDFEVMALTQEDEPTLLTPQYVYDSAMRENHSITANRLQIEAAGKQVSVAQTGWIPRLSFNAGLGSNYYTVSGMENEGFGRQLNHNFSQYVGFSLNIPIFDAFSTRNNVRRAKVNQLNAKLNYETASDNLYKAIQQAYVQAVGARERYKATEVATEASQTSLDAVTEKYGLGRATPVDFDNAKNQYVKAASERTQAKYELLLRAKILEFYATSRI